MILGILQARTSSSRLPGKVLKPLLGRPMLARQVERIRRSAFLDKLILATSGDPGDDALVELASSLQLPAYRGSLEDVLDRFYLAATSFAPDIVVRLTGDCPLADPAIIDAAINAFSEHEYDYVSNSLEPTWPDGLDVEVMSFAALGRAWSEAVLPSEREHVTPYIYKRPDQFRIGHLKQHENRSGLRWTVDDADDFAFVSKVYEILYPVNPDFSTDDILKLLELRPELAEINRGKSRNAGYVSSLMKDAKL